MTSRPTTVERAFELARSGDCLGHGDITRRLKREGFESVEGHLAGASIRTKLNEICRAAVARPR